MKFKFQFQIYDDALNLARAGLLSYSTALRLTETLKYEREYIPLEAGLRGIEYVGRMLRGNQVSSYSYPWCLKNEPWISKKI